MESSSQQRNTKRAKRTLRVRKHLRGSAEKPRLCVVKSNQHISVQLIDDERGVTLAATGTLAKEFRGKNIKKTKEGAKVIGARIAELAKAKSLSTVIFDRGHRRYHGTIAALADAAREGGLQF